MRRIMVAGIGTDVGKTVVSAILATYLDADYWKPIECGASDSSVMKTLIHQKIHSPVYSLKAPLSPHHAARLEKREICLKSFVVPQKRPLIIECVGGIFVPLTSSILSIDLFKSWDCEWIIVSRHYVGSINHTLLTLEALKRRGIPIMGIIFNGQENKDSEDVILSSKVPFLGRVLPEPVINRQTIERYAQQWALLNKI